MKKEPVKRPPFPSFHDITMGECFPLRLPSEVPPLHLKEGIPIALMVLG